MSTTIGSSELTVTPLALGGNVFGWTSDETASHSILDAFTAGGGNLIDTADGYSAWVPGNTGGDSERLIGGWLKASGKRDDVVIATKVSQHPDFKGLAGDNVKAAAEASLQRLNTDVIDLYFAHYDDDKTPLAETLAAFDALINEGKVRYYALSNYTPARIEEALQTARDNGLRLPVALQPLYSLVERTTFETGYAPIALRENLGVMPYYALASGFLTGKYTRDSDTSGARGTSVQKYFTDAGFAVVDALKDFAGQTGTSPASVALAWLISKPSVTAPIASASKPEQVADLLAATTLELLPEQVATLDAASE